MSSASELEQRTAAKRAELAQREAAAREIVEAPARAAAELAELERQRAGEQEQEARASAERWVLGNVRAIGSLASQLDEVIERVRENPNQKDIEATNGIWDKIKGRLELAEVIVRRFPGITAPKMPTVTPPGRRGLNVAELSIATPRRHLFPSIIASDSVELREAIWRYAAHQWLIGRGSALPEDLAAVRAAVVPEPDHSESIARDRANTQRQQAAAMRVSRVR